MRKLKVKDTSGNDVEIDADSLPSEYGRVSTIRAELQEEFKSTVKKRLQRQRKALLEGDESEDGVAEFVAQFMEKRGLQKKGQAPSGKRGELSKEELDRITNEVKEQHVTPLQQRLEKAEARANRLFGRTLGSAIVEAARAAGVDERLLKPRGTGANRVTPIELMFRDQFGEHEESGDFFVRNGEGFRVSREQSEDDTETVRYMGPDEFFKGLQGKDDYSDIFAQQPRQKGAGAGRGAERAPDSTPTKTIPAGDTDAFSANLEGIASGKVQVK